MIITIANRKGGSGKSTTAQAVAQGLQKKGHATLVIDTDDQNAGISSIYGAKTSGSTVYEIITGQASLKECIRHTDQGDIIPTSPLMADLDATRRKGMERRLLDAIRREGRAYDYIVIDTPPGSGLALDNALTASDGVIIPTKADVMGVMALDQIARIIKTIQDDNNGNPRILGILITQYNPRTSLSKVAAELLEQKAAEIGTTVYSTRIRETVAIAEDQATRSNFYDRPKSTISRKDLETFIDELSKQIEG